jgi:hypothetical protein
MRSEILQLAVNRIEEVSRPLREEVAMTNLLLARGTSSLDHVGVCASDDFTKRDSIHMWLILMMWLLRLHRSLARKPVVGKAAVEPYFVEEECNFDRFAPCVSSCP